MKRIGMKSLRLRYLLGALMVFAVAGSLVYMLGLARAYDWSTPNVCGGCHPGSDPEHTAVMAAVVSDWKVSEHADSIDDPGHDDNDYCARCKSPFEFNPASSYGSREIVPEEEWQGITCRVCHPRHGTLDYQTGEEIHGIGLFVGGLLVEYVEDPGPSEGPCNDGVDNGGDTVADGDDDDCALDTGAYIDVPDPGEGGEEELCTGYCHIPPRHAVNFEKYAVMHDKKGVTCFDCHMAEVDGPVEPAEECALCHGDEVLATSRLSHTWEPPEAESCLVEGCHPNKSERWAEKQTAKGIHDKGPWGQIKKTDGE